MEKVDFTYKRGGRTKSVTLTQATVLARAGLGTYQTRSMADKQMVTRPMVAASAAQVGDHLETLDKEQLHALAKERGVKVHHMAGADKVRAALRGESQQ